MNALKTYKSAILFFLAFVINIGIANAYDPGYYFEKYHFDMTVHENGSYDVVENIDAVFTEESRGIFREIPVWVWVKRDVSEKQDGSETKMLQYYVDVDNVDVSEETSEEEIDELYSIRIGSADKYIKGPHPYTIKYTLTPYGDRVEQSDLFFYSLLGVGWDCKTNQFTFSIHFDKPLTDEELKQLEVFTGELGDNTNYANAIITKATNTEIQGIRKNIEPHEAITVRIPLREGYFAENTHPKLNIQTSWILIIISAVLIAIILFLELIPSYRPTKVISFRPPKGMTSADVGAIASAEINDKCVLSLIPWLASKGSLIIDNSQAKPILRISNGLPCDAPPYVKSLFDGMFFNGSKEMDTNKPSNNFGKGWYNCMSSLTKTFQDKLNKTRDKQFRILYAAILTVSFANCFASIRDGWLVGGLTTVFFAVISAIQKLQLNSDLQKSTPTGMAFIIGLCTSFFILLMHWGCFDGEDPSYIPMKFIYMINGALFLACYLSIKLEEPTEYRKTHLGEIMGFKEFIETAEKPQLQKLQAEDEMYFYDILPYAVALGLADKWAKKFENIIVKQPSWYKGKQGEIVTSSLARLVTHSMMTKGMKNSIASGAPRSTSSRSSSSSGSSYSSSHSYSSRGGGYSGGGFGGGGGRRW